MAAGTEDAPSVPLTATGGEEDGDALLAELRRVAAEADPVPERVLQAARLAIISRDPDAELAQLVALSIADSPGTTHTMRPSVPRRFRVGRRLIRIPSRCTRRDRLRSAAPAP